MKKTTLALAGVDYIVPALNVGQLERVADALGSLAPARVPFAVLRIAMERAEPKADLDSLEASFDEVRQAVTAILTVSGMTPVVPSGEAKPATAA